MMDTPKMILGQMDAVLDRISIVAANDTWATEEMLGSSEDTLYNS